MMRSDEERRERPNPASDRQLWQRCCVRDAPEDEAERFLDLAAFADGLLEEDEHDRVAAWVTLDREAAADVRAATTVDMAGQSPAVLERVVARACAIISEGDSQTGHVVPLARWRERRLVERFAQWGSLAAAIALAGWLGFGMGSDTSLALSERQQPGAAIPLTDVFDSPSGFLNDLAEGLHT